MGIDSLSSASMMQLGLTYRAVDEKLGINDSSQSENDSLGLSVDGVEVYDWFEVEEFVVKRSQVAKEQIGIKFGKMQSGFESFLSNVATSRPYLLEAGWSIKFDNNGKLQIESGSISAEDKKYLTDLLYQESELIDNAQGIPSLIQQAYDRDGAFAMSAQVSIEDIQEKLDLRKVLGSAPASAMDHEMIDGLKSLMNDGLIHISYGEDIGSDKHLAIWSMMGAMHSMISPDSYWASGKQFGEDAVSSFGEYKKSGNDYRGYFVNKYV